MDERLRKALEFSNYNLTINNQKNNIKNRVNQLKVVHYGGGVFSATPELIAFISTMQSLGHTSLVVTDTKENPIEISKPGEFLENLASAYTTATNTYLAEWNKIKIKRKISDIMEIE